MKATFITFALFCCGCIEATIFTTIGPTGREPDNPIETRPSEEDLQGNWGVPLHGLQLSLRFPTNKYWVGQDITAIVLVRNVSSNVIHFGSPDGQVPVTFVVGAWQDRLTRAQPSAAQQPWSSKGVALPAKMQRKYLERLDNKFDFRHPGRYIVSALMRLDDRLSDLHSGNAVIEIVEGPSPAPSPQIPVRGTWSAEELRAVDRQLPVPRLRCQGRNHRENKPLHNPRHGLGMPSLQRRIIRGQ